MIHQKNIVFTYAQTKHHVLLFFALLYIAKRFNALSILKELTDKIDFVQIGNEFAQENDKRKIIFGKFSNEDLKA